MTCDAILLARGGSKGLPGKNIADLLGKPLIAWTIEAARASACVRDVVVSTDCPRIAEVARAHGASVPALRPAALAGDLASSESALAHALDALCRRPLTANFLFPQITSPFRKPGTFDAAYRHFVEGGYDSLFSATQVRNFLWRGHVMPEPQYDPQNRPMRQQLRDDEIFFRENGSFYFCRTEGFRRHGCRLFGEIGMYLMGEEEALEIDERRDLEMLALVMKEQAAGEQGGEAERPHKIAAAG